METHDLTKYGTMELTAKEVLSINGGNPWAIWAATFLFGPILTNPRAHYDVFMKGFHEGFNAIDVRQE